MLVHSLLSRSSRRPVLGVLLLAVATALVGLYGRRGAKWLHAQSATTVKVVKAR